MYCSFIETAVVVESNCAEETTSGKIAGLDYQYLQEG